ncbi:unnamed protein product [Sphagnum balticum]
MQTRLGREVCQHILNAQPEAIEFHLGVRLPAARAIAKNCQPIEASAWLVANSYQEIRKFNLNSAQARKYIIEVSNSSLPIESWTDPITNTTVLMVSAKGIDHAHLVQQLSHEMAVYFDSKAYPAHPNAQKIPQLRNLHLISSGGLDPLVAVSNPLIANSLIYIRALQVEFDIVKELVDHGVIAPPEDLSNRYLLHLTSPFCKEECLESLILKFKPTYLRIALPLIAFAPYFRGPTAEELKRLELDWSSAQWKRFSTALYAAPLAFLKTPPTGNPLADMQRVFAASPSQDFAQAETFLGDDLWNLEWPLVKETTVNDHMPLLEFLKTPLMSGYNILFSSGPRVRLRTGGTE